MQNSFWQPQVDPLSPRELEILRYVANGASDREIAEALFLSLNTIKWHNRQIYSKLGVNSRTQAVALVSQEGLLAARHAPSLIALSERKHNLPAQVTTFVGRERELGEIKQLMDSSRLLTLTGPAGVGKTRLAVEVAAALADEGAYEDGIYFVDLVPVSQPERVGDSIAHTLGIIAVAGQSIPKILSNYLESKKLLLLLDNFEHLLAAAGLAGELLAAAPDLSLLVTSREALDLYGEQEYPVPPLGLPDMSNLDSLTKLADYEAASLFIQRAQAVNPDFAVADNELSSVAEICARLDGLPLAIELAAVQVRLFTPQALLSQLEDRFSGRMQGPRGMPERQRTLRGAIDSSYELLDEPQKVLFARLSVFQGGSTIEAAEAVCCYDLDLDVLDGLASLLSKNLLRQEAGPEGEPHFTMLETIHEYARERLRQSGKMEDAQRRHAEYFAALTERALPHTRGGRDQMRWFRRLEADHDNLRAMYQWSVEGGDVELALRLVGALNYFWWRQAHYAESHQWITRALELVEGMPAEVRAGVYFSAGTVFFYLNEPDASKHALLEALALYEDLGFRREIGWTLVHLAMPSLGKQDEHEQALATCKEGLALLQEVDDKSGVAQALNTLGEFARVQGDLTLAKEVYEKSRMVSREIGDGLRESLLLINLGFIALHHGDAEGAQALLKESLTKALAIGHKAYTADKLSALSGAAVSLGQPERAARLNGAADALFERQGYLPQAGDISEYERFNAAVREHLDAHVFETAWAEGRAMKHDEAVAYALEESAVVG